jgi:N,N'-diacetyllegionaminate synthase
MEKLSIAGRSIGPDERPYIVAEIGSNHNGDMQLCRKLIDAAQDCGVDAVKFQSWSKSSLISKAEYARNTSYTKSNGRQPSLEEAVEKYQLTREQHREIADYCDERKIVFFSSCFSRQEVDLLESLNVPAHKIASMDVNHLPLLEYVAATGKPIILSTGLATLGEIERALEVLKDHKSGPVALLHCVSIYPSPPNIVNLHNIGTLLHTFDVPIGYSDHSLGAAIPLAAVALGACIIEKHFTLNKETEGWDHAISADPAEMTLLVRECQNVQAALGSTVRTLSVEQIEKRNAFRRRLVVTRAIAKGERLTADDVEFKRPGTGIRPDELTYVLGRAMARDVEADEEMSWMDLV